MSPTIYSWQPVLTDHQSYTLQALERAMKCRVRAIVDVRENKLRKKQGWTAATEGLVATEVLPIKGWRQRINTLLDEDPSAIHLFGSPFERSRINFSLIGAALRKRCVFLIAEPYSPQAVGYLDDGARWRAFIKARLRPALYAAYGTLMKKRVAGVFAISPLAVKQYGEMGLRRIFPFGYFVPSDGAARSPPTGGALEVAYLGSFIARKGVATLLDAFASEPVVASGARLTLFGPAGESVPCPTTPNIQYGGPLPFGRVQLKLAEYDLLVVPSLYDGWSVVVNEAIQAGVPVLASDGVGAGAMIERWGCGIRYPAQDSAALVREIVSICRDPSRLAAWRECALALGPALDPQLAGSYMADCMRAVFNGGPSPKAPWY